MEKSRITVLVCAILWVTDSLSAQEDARKIYEGNKLYFSGKLPQSTGEYKRALEINPNNRKASFNMGAALYKNGMLIKSGSLDAPQSDKISPDSLANLVFDQAAQNFAVVANSVSDKDTLHRAWHNIGNCYLQQKKYQEAVDAYKKSLRFDPKDEESRYNLAWALKHMPPKKNGGGGGSQQQQQQQQKQDQQKKQQQKNEMSKQQAEQLLKALMDQEKKLQDKRKQSPEKPDPNQVEKDW